MDKLDPSKGKNGRLLAATSLGVSPRPMLMGAPRNTLKGVQRGRCTHCAALYVVAHKLLNLFYGAVVALAFPLWEKLSWCTRRLAQ